MPRPLTDFGLGATLDRLDDDDLLAALTRHALLLIPYVEVDEELLVATARMLGPPEVVHPPAYRSRGNPHVRVQSNVEGLGVNHAGEYWHSDGPWSPTPSAATLVLCAEAPTVGGETLFVDMRAAHDALPEQLRTQISDLDGWFPCREIYAAELRALGLEDPEKLEELADIYHPLARRHPRSGRRALYLNEQWLRGVRGLPPGDSEAMLTWLYGFSTSGRFTLRHRWTAGDLLIWDNASVMHKALPAPPRTRKMMLRVTIAGSSAEQP